MKNFEKYGRELKKYRGGMFCDDYVKPDVLKLKKDDECDHDCVRCLVLQMIWLLEEYEEPKEPKVDWSKVEVDTPVLVRDGENDEWKRFYFAKYENGLVYTWIAGATSWTAKGNMYKMPLSWRFAKLAESEDKCEKTNKEESKIDWSQVEVDTPILVRNSEYGEWFKRHFAEYKNGKVYTWDNGYTSWTACGYMGAWNYAKLTEDEKEGKEPEIDWNKVKVDTPILVKNREDDMWRERHFAKYKNGNVYAWSDGQTSWTAYDMMVWKFAKLAEDEETK